MKTPRLKTIAYGVKTLTLLIGLCLSAFEVVAGHDMRLESIEGDVTTNEYRSFIEHLEQQFSPPPSNNIGNLMADEKDGSRIHGLQTFYEFTHDRRVLDKAVEWSDAFLHARNDPTNGRVIWTGKRDLCWPNKATNDAQALHSGAENGDVIEHIVNTARLILENPPVWNETAPPDKFSFGATYLERAKTYVRECQRSAETTLVPWFVRNTKDGYRLYIPDSPAYFKFFRENGPLPWNQQQCIAGALLRLAQCHRLLNDGDTNIAYYEKITADAAKWFFSEAVPVSVSNRVCYLWSYGLPRDPVDRPEVTYESDYDMFIFRAYQANLGPTRQQMQRLINTGRYLMYLGTNRVSGYINGTSDNNSSRHERNFFSFEWIEASVLDHDFYRLTAGNILAIHEYHNNLAVEAAVLSAKHFWATNTSPLPDIVEDASAFRPFPPKPLRNSTIQNSTIITRHWREGQLVTLLLIWIGSEFLLSVLKRSNGNAVSKDRNTLRLIWLVNTAAFTVGITASYLFKSARIPWPALPYIGYVLMVAGLTLRWYSVIYLGRFFTTNVAIARDHRVIDSGPYRFVRHPSYTGGLLAILGICLTMQNWLTLLVILPAAWLVQLRRIRVEEKALLEGLGESYQNYSHRTKRLIPLVY